MNAVAQHSSASNEHYTPIEIVNAARKVMGDIDLDPASCQAAQSRICAQNYFSASENGLQRTWQGRVFLNPPGGLVARRSSAAVWWNKLLEEWFACRVKQAIFIGFTLELLRSTQDADVWPGELPFCVPSSRLKFDQFVEGEFRSGGSPPHANIIVYLPPMAVFEGWRGDTIEKFETEFSKFGKVRT